VAKPNYSMAKRQRDLAKKAKAEEKRLRKAQAHESGQPVDAESGAEAGAEGEAEAADGSPPAEA
jgi:hypothetical protein